MPPGCRPFFFFISPQQHSCCICVKGQLEHIYLHTTTQRLNTEKTNRHRDHKGCVWGESITWLASYRVTHKLNTQFTKTAVDEHVTVSWGLRSHLWVHFIFSPVPAATCCFYLFLVRRLVSQIGLSGVSLSLFWNWNFVCVAHISEKCHVLIKSCRWFGPRMFSEGNDAAEFENAHYNMF